MFPSVYAAGQESAQSGSISMFITMAVFFLFFYLIVIRPKQKKEQEHSKLVDTLNRGDEVITYSGLMGKISRIKENYVVLNIADNVEIKMQKNHINNVLPKGTLKSI